MYARGDNLIVIINGAILFNMRIPFVVGEQGPIDAASASHPNGTATSGYRVSPGGGPPTMGYAGLASGGYGQKPLFLLYEVDVSGTGCDNIGNEGDMPHEEPCSAGSKGQTWQFVLSPTSQGPNGPGQFALQANNTLCLQQNSSADPDYRYYKTKAITLQVCNASEPKQFFTLESGAVKDNQYTVGPIQGIDGLTLNIYGRFDGDDSDISAYPWQAGPNAHWFWVSNGAADRLHRACGCNLAWLAPARRDHHDHPSNHQFSYRLRRMTTPTPAPSTAPSSARASQCAT